MLRSGVLRSALASDAASLIGTSPTTIGEDMGYLHSTQISHIYADSYTLRRVGSRTGPVYPLYYTYYPYYLYYPRFPYMFPFPHTCTYDNWYLVLLLGTATGRYLRQLFLQHKYTQACAPLYNRCSIRQCQTAGEADHNKELNTQAIVVSIGNHTSLDISDRNTKFAISHTV